MATEPMFAALDVPTAHRRLLLDRAMLWDYWTLTKPEVNFLIVVTTFAGFYLGNAEQAARLPLLQAINTVLGTLLVASGTGTLNQYIERRYDARMRRTSRRPLAAGRLEPFTVLWFGMTLSFAGIVYLAFAVNKLASLLTLVTLLSYLFLYTPLKRKSPLCTLVGAFPGAMPPLIGWAGATGRLPVEAWALYAMLFLWQFPHFMAIAWMYREDYDRAGYLVLPHESRARISLVNLQTLLPLVALVLLSLFLITRDHVTVFCSIPLLLLSIGFFEYGVKFVLHKTNQASRRLLAASIIYLPLLFVLIVAGKR